MKLSSFKKTLLLLLVFCSVQLIANDKIVSPGENIQNVIDAVSEAGGGVVTLSSGIHDISSALKVKSNITLQGEANLSSILRTDDDIKMIIQAGEGLENITIQNLILIGSPTRGAGGIHITSMGTDHKNVKLLGVHVYETGWGVHIKGAENVTIEDCLFVYNGNPESLKFAHNLYLRRCYGVKVRNSKFNHSTSANGINISYSKDIEIYNCEAIGNHFRGMRAADSDGFLVHNCVISGNGNVGLLANSEKVITKNIDWQGNYVSNNGEHGISARPGATGICKNNISYGNKVDYFISSEVTQANNISEKE